MMQLAASTWSGDDSELNLAPGQVALSSANYCLQRLGGCNNHLKGEIKAPLNGVLCSRPHLMLCGLCKAGRRRRFKCLPPKPGWLQWAGERQRQRRGRPRWRRGPSRWSGWPRAAAGERSPSPQPAGPAPRPETPVTRSTRRPSVSPASPRWRVAQRDRWWRPLGRRGTAATGVAALYVTARRGKGIPPSRTPDAPILSPQPRSGTRRPRTTAASSTKRTQVVAPSPGGPAPNSPPRSCRSWSGASASSAISAPARSGAWPPSWTSPRARWARPGRPGPASALRRRGETGPALPRPSHPSQKLRGTRGARSLCWRWYGGTSRSPRGRGQWQLRVRCGGSPHPADSEQA